MRTKSQEDILKYNKQQNFCKKLLRTTNKLYFSDLDIKKVVDNRSFWKTVSPLFSTKCSKDDKMILHENDKCVSNDDELCQIFCGYFSNIISDLQIPSISKNISKATDITDPVLAAINMFQDYPSIKNVRAKSFKYIFSLTQTNEIEIKKIIRGMNVHKTCLLKDIPTKIIKMNSNIFANFICYTLTIV